MLVVAFSLSPLVFIYSKSSGPVLCACYRFKRTAAYLLDTEQLPEACCGTTNLFGFHPNCFVKIFSQLMVRSLRLLLDEWDPDQTAKPGKNS